VTYQDSSTTAYMWDAGNRVTQLVDPLSGTITRTYDGLDRLTQEVTPQDTVSYTYDASGRRATMTVLGQPTVTYGYDVADRLAQIAEGSATFTVAYDTANRRTSLMLPNGVGTSYTYDAASRLTGLSYALGGTPLGTLTYSYDANGHRTVTGGTWAATGLPQPVASATYDAANRQVTFGGLTLSYDLNGNLTGDGTTIYTWDARNQLVGITGASVTASFGYDPRGRRQGKTVNGTATQFLYDGLTPVQEQQGDSPAANLLTGLGIDEYFTSTDATGASHFLTDALGSTIALADATGRVQTTYTYEPFGATTITGAAITNSFDYTGRANDGIGLYYYRARYYHPGLQRFIAEDPIEFAGGDPNLYAYVANNPTAHTDPTGLVLALGNLPTWHPCVTPFFGRKSLLASLGSDLACSIAFTPPTGTLAGPRFVPSGLGRPGAGRGVLEFPGGGVGRDRLFEQLKQGGKPYTPSRGSYPGDLYQLPDGTVVGSRPGTSGTPTIDLNLGGKGNIELKFPPGF
jgi:RHS repeat-associated protein